LKLIHLLLEHSQLYKVQLTPLTDTQKKILLIHLHTVHCGAAEDIQRSCPRRHLTRDLAAQLALSLSLITPNKLTFTLIWADGTVLIAKVFFKSITLVVVAKVS
jgi:hypothetical protein